MINKFIQLSHVISQETAFKLFLFSRFEANRKTDKNADGVVSDIKGAKTSY